MKKFLLFILTFVYMSVTTGVAMEIHYCMGKKAGVDFYHADKGVCSKCGMKEKKSGCCSDEHQFYKLNDAHKNTSNNSNVSFLNQSIGLINHCHQWEVFAQTVCDPLPNIPSFDTGPTRCIKYCVFRL